jgi:hypothetical protein
MWRYYRINSHQFLLNGCLVSRCTNHDFPCGGFRRTSGLNRFRSFFTRRLGAIPSTSPRHFILGGKRVYEKKLAKYCLRISYKNQDQLAEIVASGNNSNPSPSLNRATEGLVICRTPSPTIPTEDEYPLEVPSTKITQRRVSRENDPTTTFDDRSITRRHSRPLPLVPVPPYSLMRAEQCMFHLKVYVAEGYSSGRWDFRTNPARLAELDWVVYWSNMLSSGWNILP